jgi:hypothetical protein
MSEYQRYEFMTVDRPLTPAELEEVDNLSSHIEASPTYAVIEYHWGDFKHNPIGVLHQFFDGFLYWANWGSPRLAFRFPRGVLPANLLADYDFEDFVTFSPREKYDILDIHFGEMEAPDRWVEYQLSSLIAIRDELMAGDQRALYIAWLASYSINEGDYGEDYEDEDEEYDDEDYDEDYDEDEDENYGGERSARKDRGSNIPPVPPDFGKLTAAQRALAELLQVSPELLSATARHSQSTQPAPDDDFAAWIKLLSEEQREDYLLRLARNEPGLNRLLVRELRALGRPETSATTLTGERVPYETLLAESKTIRAELEREARERAEAERQRRLQEVHNHQDIYWQQATQAAERGVSSGYNEATQVLIELREVARHYQETQKFQERFNNWVQAHQRRPALLKRLRENRFALPDM